MKTTIGALALVTAAACACFGQTVQPGKLKLNGVGLDSTYPQVVKALGKPSKETKPKKEECTGGRERSLTYQGAWLYLIDGDTKDPKAFKVASFNVTSAKYSVSGIKVGDSQLTVRRVLGGKFESSTDRDGTITWTYDIGEPEGPGWTNVTFRDGRVMRISSSYAVC